MHDCGAWMSKDDRVRFMHLMCCLLSVKKQKHDFHFRHINIRFGFCDIQNNRALSKSYQPQLLALTDNRYLYLIILDNTKTSSNYCLQSEIFTGYYFYQSFWINLHLIYNHN